MGFGATIGVVMALAAGQGSGLPQGAEPVKLSPADFTTQVDNRWFPLRPGSRWVYRETAQGEPPQRVEVRVLRRTKRIANGITARVVRDTVTQRGRLVEDTFDWYAQDRDGNVWYLGEDTKSYENGRFKSGAGSWEAGVDGAQAGVIMPASPRPGMAYRQEHYAGHAEDSGVIMSTGEQVEVSFGHRRNVLMTKDLSPLEPKVLEFKFYAPGIGMMLAVGVSGSTDREELVSFRRGT